MKKSEAAIDLGSKGRSAFSYFVGDVFVTERPLRYRWANGGWTFRGTFLGESHQLVMVDSRLPKRERNRLVRDAIKSPPPVGETQFFEAQEI